MIPDIFIKGGPLMVLIFGCSIVSLACFVERVYHFRRARLKIRPFMEKLKAMISKGLFEQAVSTASSRPGPVAAVLKSGLVKHGLKRERIKESMEESMTREISRLEKNIPIIATVSHISPLIGLLGTVLGMIEAFMVIQSKGGVVNPADLAGGISEALITTASGLVVAIPSYMAYSFLTSRVEAFSMEMEKNASEIVDLIEIAGNQRTRSADE